MANAGAEVVGGGLAATARRGQPPNWFVPRRQGNSIPRCSSPRPVLVERVRGGDSARRGRPGHVFNLARVPPDADPGVLAKIVELVHAEGAASRAEARRGWWRMARVVVVGGGISGLVAARDAGPLRPRCDPRERGSAGAARSPPPCWMASGWTPVLRRCWLAGWRQSPSSTPSACLTVKFTRATQNPSCWLADDCTPMPRSVGGVPTDLAQLGRLLSAEGLSRAQHEPTRSAGPTDVAIGTLVDERLGPEVTDRLVEPLLSGFMRAMRVSFSFAAVSSALYLKARTGGHWSSTPGPLRTPHRRGRSLLA